MNNKVSTTKESDKIDNVNHPSHYCSHPSGVECIEITEHYNFCIGNAIKYLFRQGLKQEEGMDPVEKQIEDCKKAIWYIQRQIMNLEKGVKNGKKRAEQDEEVEEGGKEIKPRTGTKAYRASIPDGGSYDAKTFPRLHSSDGFDEGYNYGGYESGSGY